MGGIPVFLDIFSNEDIAYLLRHVGSNAFFVTSYEAYRRVKEKSQVAKVSYMPLCVAKKWLHKDYPNKTIDVVQIGRRNQVLHDYMLQYCKDNPHVEYIYAEYGLRKKGINTYISTTRGEIGEICGRIEYMKLLEKAKVSLVSSPGADNSRKNTNGFDFPTPRFYESASQYCYMLGRYTRNEEMKMLEIESVCDYIETYEDLKNYMNSYLNSSVFIKLNAFSSFLEKNTTDQRAELLEKSLLNIDIS